MVGVSNPKWREEPGSEPMHLPRWAPNQTKETSKQVTLKQERVRASVCARGVQVEGWERGRERDLDRHIQECQRPGAGGGVARCCFLLDTNKQSPWERGRLFWTQEDKGLTQTRKEKKQKCSCGTQNTSFELDLIQFHQVNRLGSPWGWAGVEAV